MTQVLRVGTLRPLERFDPRSAGDIAKRAVWMQVYEPLNGIDPDTKRSEPLLLEGSLRSEAPVFPLMHGPRLAVSSRRVTKRPKSARFGAFFAQMELQG